MANLSKVIYINEKDYSTLVNGGTITKSGQTYSYDESALYVIKDVSAPEYAETAGYATNSGHASTASSDANGNNIVQTYEKKPLIIEVNESDDGNELEQGTYNSITQALTLNKQVILKIIRDNHDDEIIYLPLVGNYSSLSLDYKFGATHSSNFYYALIDDTNYFELSNYYLNNSDIVHKSQVETITGNKTFTGTVTAVTQPNGDNSTKVATTAYVLNVTGDFVKHSNTTIESRSASWDTSDFVTIEGIDMHIGSSTLSVPAGQGVTISATNTYPVYIVNSDLTKILSAGENGSVSWENHTGSTKLVYVTIDDEDRSSTYNFELYSIGYDNEVEYLEDMVGVEVFELDGSLLNWTENTTDNYYTTYQSNYDLGELYQAMLNSIKLNKEVKLYYNGSFIPCLAYDNATIHCCMSLVSYGTLAEIHFWVKSDGTLIREEFIIQESDIKSSIDKANSAVLDVTITQSSSTNAGTTIQVDNGTTYTIVSDTEPQGSDRAYKAPSWGAMEDKMDENELVVSAALNDLNTRINDLNDEKQDTLVSGTDIKTINNQSILGSGNIDITSDLGDSLVAMFSKLDEITPVRTIEYDIASTTGQIIYSRANVTEDMLNTVTDTLIYSIEVTGNSDANIYAQYKVYAHFQPCPTRSPMTFIEHIHRNPAGTASLEGLKLLTYYYPKAVNNGYPYICYITAPATGSRHVKIRVYLDSSNVDWKNPAVPVAATEGLYNTTYLTKGSEMTITASGWITNGITQAATTTATVSTSLPKNFTANIFLAGEALTGGNLVYRALNDGKIYRVGTLTATINDVSTNLTLDPMFGVTRIINSRAINANIPASDLDYKRSINPSTPNNGSSFQIETGWVKGDTMYYKCTLSGSSLIPTGHITSTLSPGYAYFPIGVINTASSMDFDCIGHEFVTLNASGKVTHVNGLEIAGGSGGGGSQDLSDYVKYSNTISSTDSNGSCSSSETVEDNAIYTSGSTHYVINPGYTISLDVLSDTYTTYIINNTSPKAILASGTGDIEWTNTTSSNVDVQVGSGTSGLYYIATIYLKGYTEEVGEIKEKLESINGVLVLPLSITAAMASTGVEDYVNLDESVLPSDYILRITTQLDNILSFYHQNLYNPLYILFMNDTENFDNPVPHTVSSCMYLGNNDFSITIGTTFVEFKKNGLLWKINKAKETYNKIHINGSSFNEYAPSTSGIINLPLKTVNNQQIFGSGNILTTNAPLLEKTYENYTCAAANVEKGYIYFMNVVPTSDNYYEPWYVHYILEITTSVDLCLGYYEITMGSAGTTSLYRHFNRLYSTSYIPTYYHLMAWHNSAAKYANKATYPIKLGERIYSAYGTTTVARTYNIKVIDMYNCTVTFPDNIETYDSFYSDSNYGYNSYWNAYVNGGMDNWDANTVPYLYYEHYPLYYIHDAQTPLYRYKICGFDDDNRLVPVTITNRTSVSEGTLTPCKVPMAVSRGLVYYATSTNITDPTVLTANGVIYRGNEVGIEYFRYNFDTLPGNNLSVYLKGTYTISTDTFVLDDDYYVFVPTNVTSSSYSTYFTEGKYYWYVGRTGNYTTANYGGFNLNNPLYQYNGTKLVPITSIISSSGGGGDTNVIETVKVNGTALTPDANKAVNITSIPSSIVTQDATHRFVSDTEKSTWNGKLNALLYYSEFGDDVCILVQTDLIRDGSGTGSYGELMLLCLDEATSSIIAEQELSADKIKLYHEYFDTGVLATTSSEYIELRDGIKLNQMVDNVEQNVTLDTTGFKFNNKQIATTDLIPTESTVSGWGFTKNTGTITGINMNGASKGTSGVVDLGTVLTAHLSIKTINGSTITGTGNVTIATPGILKSDNTTAQTTANNESLSGTVNLHKISKTGNYNDLIDKPTIPASVTESTVSGWGFTKNAGTITGVTGSNGLTGSGSSGSVTISHAAPSTSPAKSTSAVYPITIDKYGHITAAGTAVTIPTQVTELTVSGWGFTKNVGTVTSVEVNGTTASLDAGGCVSIDAITGIEYASHPITATNGVVDILTAILTEINAAKVTIYSGTAAPSNSLGTNGDLYLLTS